MVAEGSSRVTFDDADLAVADILLTSFEGTFAQVFAELRELRAMQALSARQLLIACSLHMSAVSAPPAPQPKGTEGSEPKTTAETEEEPKVVKPETVKPEQKGAEKPDTERTEEPKPKRHHWI
jgi:hypothetical protein